MASRGAHFPASAPHAPSPKSEKGLFVMLLGLLTNGSVRRASYSADGKMKSPDGLGMGTGMTGGHDTRDHEMTEQKLTQGERNQHTCS